MCIVAENNLGLFILLLHINVDRKIDSSQINSSHLYYCFYYRFYKGNTVSTYEYFYIMIIMLLNVLSLLDEQEKKPGPNAGLHYTIT